MHPYEPLAGELNQWFEIFRRHRMGSFSSYARDNGLTMAQFGVMLQLHHKGACGVSDIGSELGVTNSAASQMLDRLVQLELITRSEDPADRRVKQIDLTEKGHSILHGSHHSYNEWLEKLRGSMTAEEKEQVSQAMATLIEKAQALDAAKENTQS